MAHHLAAPLVRVEANDMGIGWAWVFHVKLSRHQMAEDPAMSKASVLSQSLHSIVRLFTFYGFEASSRHISIMFSTQTSLLWYVRSRLPF